MTGKDKLIGELDIYCPQLSISTESFFVDLCLLELEVMGFLNLGVAILWKISAGYVAVASALYKARSGGYCCDSSS